MRCDSTLNRECGRFLFNLCHSSSEIYELEKEVLAVAKYEVLAPRSCFGWSDSPKTPNCEIGIWIPILSPSFVAKSHVVHLRNCFVAEKTSFSTIVAAI